MNILFVSSDNDLYHGAFLSMVKLASILQEKYDHHVVVALPYEGDGVKLLDESNLRHIVIPSRNWVIVMDERRSLLRMTKEIVKYLLNKRAEFQLRKLIKKEKIDIVHINTSWTYVGAAAAVKEKKALVWHIREFLEEDQNVCIWCRGNGYDLMKKADAIVAISSSLFDKYAALLGPEHMRMINNGIDPELFCDREHRIMENEILRFVLVGGLIDRKGQKDAINACIRLLETGFDRFFFELVGDDSSEYAREAKAIVEENNAEEHIVFRGSQPHPEEYYKRADITFMCSASEGFGRVTVEAMMGGSLVIGAKAAGTLDIIDDGITGLFYDPGDAEDLCRRIQYAINHPDKARAIAERGRDEAMRNMTAERNADLIDQLYSEVSHE